MDSHVKDVVRECARASDEERIAFKDVVMQLAAVGVERYHADLLRWDKIFYMPDGSSETIPGERLCETAGRDFSAAGIEAAVRTIQTGQIKYKDFCRRIADAGCVFYLVSLTGSRAVYYGRTGESHVERFPGSP